MTTTRQQTQEMMKQQTWGCELEYYRLSLEGGAKVLANYFHTTYRRTRLDHDGTSLNAYEVFDPRGRRWLVVHDGSLSGDDSSGELVTPVMRYEDIEEYQAIVRAFREAGAKSDYTHGGCGVHVHIGADIGMEGGHTPRSLRNLSNLVKKVEPLLINAIGISQDRMHGYCAYTQQTNPDFLRRLNRIRPRTMEQLKTIWYEGNGVDEIFCANGNHYNPSRYHFLNLHPIFLKTLAGEPEHATAEFRFFELHGQIHAGYIKSFIQLALTMNAYSKVVARISPDPINYSHNPKFAMRNWLNNMGLIGDEFKTIHKLLTKRLYGDASYRNGRPRPDVLDDLYLAE